MTSKQRKFIELYEGNATKTAIAAGYSAKTARAQGQRLLTKVDIRKAITTREEKMSTIVIANRQQRQKFWSDIMDNSKIKIDARLKASELLAKSEGDFVKKIEWNTNNNLAERIKEGRERVLASQ